MDNYARLAHAVNKCTRRASGHGRRVPFGTVEREDNANLASAKHIRLEYGFAVPPWVLEDPLKAGQLDKAFGDLTKRLKQWDEPIS